MSKNKQMGHILQNVDSSEFLKGLSEQAFKQLKEFVLTPMLPEPFPEDMRLPRLLSADPDEMSD